MNQSTRVCSFDACDRPRKDGDLCKAHGQQRRRGKTIRPITRGVLKSFEEATAGNYEVRPDGCWQWTGHIQTNGYVAVTANGIPTRAHRAAFIAAHGEIPAGLMVDHKCRNKSCVNPDHVHAVTRKENGENVGLSKANSSGARGVSWDPATQRWAAKIMHHGKSHWVGRFDAIADAERAVTAKRLELFTNSLSDH